MNVKYKSIGLKEPDYDALAEKKESLEKLIGKRLDWADFLLLLADLKPMSQIVGYPVAEMHEDEPMTDEEIAEAGIETYDGLPVTLTESDQERIANLVATKVLERLKTG